MIFCLDFFVCFLFVLLNTSIEALMIHRKYVFKEIYYIKWTLKTANCLNKVQVVGYLFFFFLATSKHQQIKEVN